MNPSERDARLEELLQYRFGCHEDPAGLERRMQDDPEWMRLMGEADDAAALLSRAARAEGPRVPFDDLAQTTEDVLDEPTRRFPWRRVFAAAAALVVLVVAGFVARAAWSGSHLQELEQRPHRLVLSGPSSIPDASPASFRIETWNTFGAPMPAELRWRLADEDGEVLLGDVVRSNGSYDLAIPPRLKAHGVLTVEAEDASLTSSLELTAGGGAPLAHLTVDKPMFRPGETVYLRALILDRLSLRAREGGFRFRIVDAQGAVQEKVGLRLDHGVAAMRWTVPPGAAGGRYGFELRDDADKVTVERIEFVVRDYQPPTLAKEIDLDRESYAPGQAGAAEISIQRLSGGPAAGAAVTGKLIVDGIERSSKALKLDTAGRAILRFTVPEDVRVGDARIVAIVDDRGVIETAVEPFLVPTGTLLADAYPEGGDLIAAVENRVYVEVTDPLGRPADAIGTIVDNAGTTVASFETEHLGRGRFVLTPKRGEKYQLVLSPRGDGGRRIGDPAATRDDGRDGGRGIAELSRISLPAAVDGVTIRSLADSFAAGQDLRVQVTTPADGPWVVAAFCRGAMVASDTFLGRGAQEIAIPIPAETAGVLRITVFDRALKPLAERLVHRASDRDLQLDVAFDDRSIAPGEHQRVTVRASDRNGRPTAVALGVTVTDRAVRELLQEPRIGISDQTWLVADIDGVELEKLPDLLAKDDDARRGIDLLLGTRGWRRFAWSDPDAARAAQRGDAESPAAATDAIANQGSSHDHDLDRLLVMEGVTTTPRVRDSDDHWSEALTLARRQAREHRSEAIAALTISITLFALIGLWLGIGALTRRVAPTLRFVPPIAATTGCVAAVLIAARVTMNTAPPEEARVTLRAEFAEAEIEPLVEAKAPAGNAAGARLALGDLPAEAVQADVGWNALGGPGGAGPGGYRLNDIALGGAPGKPGGGGPGAAPPRPPGAGPGAVNEDPRNLAADAKNLLRENGYLADFYDDRDRRDAPRYRRLYAVRTHLDQEEFAHRANQEPGRRDFTETVYWRPLLITGDDGVASFEFDVSDRVTTWDVLIDAHGAGAVGQATRGFVSRIPFHLEATVPAELTSGDQIDLPIAAVSEDPGLSAARLSATITGPLRATGEREGDVSLQDGGGRWLLPLEATTSDKNGGRTARIEILGDAKRFGDRLEHELRVVPRGFPRYERVSGRLRPSDPDEPPGAAADATAFTLRLPDTWTSGSLRCDLKVYPAPLASLRDGMAGMLRTPSGCFEQASSSNYPNIMALAFVDAVSGDAVSGDAVSGDDIGFVRKARDLLPIGYDKIAGFECSQRGYEWFGSNPGHESLSAYGLLEFHDMAQVFDGVDKKMVARTREWLLSRRDGDGGYLRNERALDSFGRAPAEVMDAYITYALARTGATPDEISTELDRAELRSADSGDPYEVALAALALAYGGRDDAADRARDRLKSWQGDDGAVLGTTSSITSSRGANLAVETTGFAILAWLMDEADLGAADRAVDYLLTRRQGSGCFGATQATVVALQALTAHANATRQDARGGTIVVRVNQHEVVREAFTADARGPLSFPAIAEQLLPGDNTIEIALTGGAQFPFVMEAQYFTEQPADHQGAAVQIRTELKSARVVEGDTVPLVVKTSNRTGEGIPMTLARIGIPASLVADTRILDDLKKAGRFDLWELSGRELTLYWRCLAPEETKEVTIDLIARIPGQTTGPASRAYLYYTDDEVRWAAPLSVEVTPR